MSHQPFKRWNHTTTRRLPSRLPKQTLPSAHQDRILPENPHHLLSRRLEQRSLDLRDLHTCRERRSTQERLFRCLSCHWWSRRRSRRHLVSHSLPNRSQDSRMASLFLSTLSQYLNIHFPLSFYNIRIHLLCRPMSKRNTTKNTRSS